MKLQNEPTEIETDTSEATDGEVSIHKLKDSSQEQIKKNRIKFVAKLLIDSKYGLMDDVNYNTGFSELKNKTTSKERPSNPVVNEFYTRSSLDKSDNNTNSNNNAQIINIPRSTRIKADRVRIYLDNYYSKLESSIAIENPERIHEGVEGVYNPLQVIRNRKVKKKHGDMPPRQLSMQKSPLIAVLEFSKKPHKRMPWFVDVAETGSDMTWRTAHWDELVDPQGKLWFGKNKDVNDSSSQIEGPYNKNKWENHIKHQHQHQHRHRHHHHLRRPYHVGRYIPIGSLTRSHDNITTMDDSRHKDSPPERPESRANSEFGSNDRLDNHLAPLDAADQEYLSANSDKSGLNRFEFIMKKPRWSKSPNRRKSHVSTDKFIPIDQTKTGSTTNRTSRPSYGSSSSALSSNISTAPLTNTSTDGNGSDLQISRTNLLSAVPIHRLRNPGPEIAVDDDDGDEEEGIDPLQKEPVKPVKQPANGNEYEQVDEQLQEYRDTTRFLMGTLRVVKHRKMTDDIIRKRYIQRRCKIQHDKNMSLIVSDTSEMLKTYDQELERALKKGNNYASSLLNDYSMRVETLISTTDRILSDINTTLTLKLKMFQENADRFGTLRMMKSQKFTKMLYGVLELSIILVFWTIWLAVSILKYIKLGFVFIVKLLKWMLW